MTKDIDLFTFSKRLFEGLAKLDTSASDLAARSGVAKSSVSDYLQRKGRAPRWGTVVKLAKTIGFDPRYLSGEIGTPGSWTEYIQSKNNALAEARATYDPDASNHLHEFEIGTVLGDFGVKAAARVLVDTSAAITSGELYLVDLPDDGRRVCYFAEPYLMWMGSDGEMRHTARTSEIEVLGRIVQQHRT